MVKRFIFMVIVSFVVMFLYCILGLPYTNRLPSILFTGCGILFSVGMSQLMTYDLKEVVNEEVFKELTKSIKFFQKSFVMQFYYSSVAFLFLEILSEKSELNKCLTKTIKGKEFSAEIFLIAILGYCFFYFLNNYRILSEKKMKLDSIIRQEKIEE